MPYVPWYLSSTNFRISKTNLVSFTMVKVLISYVFHVSCLSDTPDSCGVYYCFSSPSWGIIYKNRIKLPLKSYRYDLLRWDGGTENRILPIHEMQLSYQPDPFPSYKVILLLKMWKKCWKVPRKVHEKPYSDWDPFQIQQITLQTDCVEAKIRQEYLIS